LARRVHGDNAAEGTGCPPRPGAQHRVQTPVFRDPSSRKERLHAHALPHAAPAAHHSAPSVGPSPVAARGWTAHRQRRGIPASPPRRRSATADFNSPAPTQYPARGEAARLPITTDLVRFPFVRFVHRRLCPAAAVVARVGFVQRLIASVAMVATAPFFQSRSPPCIYKDLLHDDA
jgi:hypothetical protein